MQSMVNDGAKGSKFVVRPFMASNKRLLDDNVFNSYEWDSSPLEIKPKYDGTGNLFQPFKLGGNTNLFGVGIVVLILLMIKK